MRTRCLTRTIVALVGLALASGCGGDEGVGDPVEAYSVLQIESTFDVQGDFGDSGLGKLLDMFRDMSDHDEDPGRFVVEKVIEKIPAPLRWAAEPFESVLGAEVNDQLDALVPGAGDEIQAIAGALSDRARKFAIRSVLDVGLDAKGRKTGTHRIETIIQVFKEARLELPATELGDKLAPATRIPITLGAGEFEISEHRLKFPVGTMLSRALPRLVIPGVLGKVIESAALIARWFACADTAAKVAEKLDDPRAGAIAMTACASASKSISDQIEERLAKIDEEGRLRLEGSADEEGEGTYPAGGWRGAFRIDKEVEASIDPQRNTFSTQEQMATQ
jgi:hypothetical protein